MDPLSVTRTPHRLLPDPKRVITKPFLSGTDVLPNGKSRFHAVLDRIRTIPEVQIPGMLEGIVRHFSPRHRDFEGRLDDCFDAVSRHIHDSETFSRERRQLVGAYCSHEYSIEAAALCNPSIVAAPDQSGLPSGSARFIMSLRAIGEGHISSIEFRSGVIESDDSITIDSMSPFALTGKRVSNPAYQKEVFESKLRELGFDNPISQWVLERLAERFNLEELMGVIAQSKYQDVPIALKRETIEVIHWLATSNYDVVFSPDSEISERTIFPDSPTESHGMEDARFVRFVDDDGAKCYYATYTAYDGHDILPQLIETRDFLQFKIRTLNGTGAQNKGMALFPRRIAGKFAMLSRHDGESLYYMTSDTVRFWHDAEVLRMPRRHWEMIQIGNCGSPIETEEGWLVLTHGVGPMRTYAIGAMLLDLEDPRRVIGELPGPLLTPETDEREGYVPNVVYTCGGLLHNGQLILPYGFSDVGIHIATVPLDELLVRLQDQVDV
ncbi:MAG: glycosidase [Myxococcales bacterium]|nr:MAG: glycosidase [Myxococcales bacterium]